MGRWLVVAAAIWVVALGCLVGVAAATAGRIHDYGATHGYITIDGSRAICINDSLCDDNTTYPAPSPPPKYLPPPTLQ